MKQRIMPGGKFSIAFLFLLIVAVLPVTVPAAGQAQPGGQPSTSDDSITPPQFNQLEQLLGQQQSQDGDAYNYGGISRLQIFNNPASGSGSGNELGAILRCNYARAITHLDCELEDGAPEQITGEDISRLLNGELPPLPSHGGRNISGVDIFVTEDNYSPENLSKFHADMDQEWIRSSRCRLVCVTNEATGELVCKTIC